MKKEKYCPNCKELFIADSGHQKFCNSCYFTRKKNSSKKWELKNKAKICG